MPHGCQRIDITGGQTTQTAIAQRHVWFFFHYIGKAYAQFLQCLLCGFEHAQVVQVVRH